MRGDDLDRLANPSLKKIGGARGGREREKDNNPSNWLAVFASLNYVILRIPRETRNSGIKENPWWLRVCVCERSSPFTLSSIDSNRIRSLNVDIRRYTRTKNYLDGLDGAKRIINSLNSLSKVLSTYVTKPPLVPNLRPNSLTEKRAKQENYRFIVYQSCWAFVQQSPSFDFGLIARESRKNERTGFESVVGDP